MLPKSRKHLRGIERAEVRHMNSTRHQVIFDLFIAGAAQSEESLCELLRHQPSTTAKTGCNERVP